MEAVSLHHWLPYVGIVGLLLTQWRFHVVQRQAALKERDGLTAWRTTVNNEIQNLKSYAARIEDERKETDKGHERTFERISEKLDGLKEGQTRIETELKAHRKICESRQGQGKG